MHIATYDCEVIWMQITMCTADFWLPFLPLGSTPGVMTQQLDREDDSTSDLIVIADGFPFGPVLHTAAFVSVCNHQLF